MAKLSINLLGPFEVKLDDVVITGFESNKVRAMLAYLAAEAPRPQPRDRLAGLLWPDWTQKSALSNLRHVLSELRKNLEDQGRELPCLFISRSFIEFNLSSDCRVDLVEFDQKLQNVNRKLMETSCLEQTVSLYRGEFLEDFYLADSPDFETWMLGKRESYRQQYMKFLFLLAECCEEQGEYERGLGYARERLKIEPWQEETHRQVIRLLALSGQRAAAVRQYEICRHELERELGIRPADETLRLVERIRQGEIMESTHPKEIGIPILIKFAAKARHNLPNLLTRFVGRRKECAQVKDLLMKHRLVTLIGPGGVGKTRLSIQVAEQVVENYQDGIRYVELAPVTDPELVVQTLASALGLSGEQGSLGLDEVQQILLKRNYLILFDNCEHLVEMCAQIVNQILQACPRIHFFVSSRESLGVPGEAVYRMPSLAWPDSPALVDQESLLQYEAIELFMDRAQGVMPGFEISDRNAAAIIQICRRLDGIPLAIELAAGRLDLMTTEQLANRLDDAFHLLTGGARTALPRQQTLRGTIDWSYRLLSEPERLLLQRHSVFTGGCTLEGAESVCSGDGLEAGGILEVLDSLVDQSMVSLSRIQGEEARYRLLETVRQYAREKLFDAGGGRVLLDRHLDYFVQLGETGLKKMLTVDRSEWVRRLAAEMDNIRAAVDWAYSNGQYLEKGLTIAAAFGFRYMRQYGYREEGLRWVRRGLEKGDTQNISALLMVRIWMAVDWLGRNFDVSPTKKQLRISEEVVRLCQDFGSFTRPLEEAVRLCRKIGPSANPELAYSLGLIATDKDDPQEAAALFEEALEIARGLGDEHIWICGKILSSKSLTELRFLDYEAARLSALAAINLSKSKAFNGLMSTGEPYMCLAEIAHHDQDYATERLYLEKLVDLEKDKGGRNFGGASFMLADHLYQHGEYELSILHNNNALQAYFSLPDREHWVNLFLSNIAINLAVLGVKNHPEALLFFSQAVALFSCVEKSYPTEDEDTLEDYKKAVPYLEAEHILRSSLSPEEYQSAWSEGQSMTLEQGVELATEIAASMSR